MRVAWQVRHGDPDNLLRVGVDPTRRWLVSSGDDGVVRVWNAITGEALHASNNGLECAPLRFHPLAPHVVCPSAGCRLKIWDLQTGALVRETSVLERGVNDVALHPDGRLAVTGFGGERAQTDAALWDLETGRLLRALPLPTPFNGAEFYADGRLLWFAAGAGPGNLSLWNVEHPARLATSPCAIDDEEIRAYAVAPRDAAIVTGGAFGRLQRLDADALKATWDIQAHDEAIEHVAWLDRAGLVLTVDGAGQLAAWRVEDGAAAGRWSLHRSGVSAIAGSEHARLAAAGADGRLVVFDPRVGVPELVWEGGDPLSDVAWVDDETVVIAGWDGVVRCLR